MDVINITVDGRPLEANPGRSLLQACLDAGIYIPHLCSHPDLPSGRGQKGSDRIFRGCSETKGSAEAAFEGCRLCLVTLEGEPEPVASCDLQAAAGMIIQTDTPELKSLRRKNLSRILTTHPHACLTCAQAEGCSLTDCSSNVPEIERCCDLFGNCEIQKVAACVGIAEETPRFVHSALPVVEDEPLFKRDYNLCINCTRCVRACRELRGVEALNFTGNEGDVIVGHVAATLQDSGCKFCLACVEVCPSGALLDKPSLFKDYESMVVPCRASCPAGTNVPHYVHLSSEGRFRDAALVVRESAPFPAILGYICFHPCEDACKRAELSESIAICAIKRRAAEDDDLSWIGDLPPLAETGKSTAVVGSGPAGLTAAYYLRSKGHRVTVFEAQEEPGGMLRYGIPDFRLPRRVVDKEIEVLRRRGVEFRTGVRVGQDISFDEIKREYQAVVLAPGAGVSKRLDLSGSDLPGIIDGLKFLEKAARGELSAREFAGKRIVVIGGGNVAMDCARSVLRYGADQVEVRCLESRGEMPAYAPEIAAAEEEGIVILNSWGPAEFIQANDSLSSVIWKKCTRVFDDEKKFSPQYDDLIREESSTDAVIVAIGQDFDLTGFNELSTHSQGFFEIKPDTGATKQPGIFAAGDAAGSPPTGGSVIDAITSGKRVAQAVDLFLSGDGDITEHLLPSYSVPSHLGRHEDFYDRQRQPMPCLPVADRFLGSPLVESGFSNEMTRFEADRCLRCSLRLQISSPILPPERWMALSEENVSSVPAAEGVIKILDSAKVPIIIKGTVDMRAELEEQLKEQDDARYFLFDPDPMYSKRESELIQQHLQKYGQMPGGAAGELDDLF